MRSQGTGWISTLLGCFWIYHNSPLPLSGIVRRHITFVFFSPSAMWTCNPQLEGWDVPCVTQMREESMIKVKRGRGWKAGQAVPHSWCVLFRLTPHRCMFKNHGQCKPAGWVSSSVKLDTHAVLVRMRHKSKWLVAGNIFIVNSWVRSGSASLCKILQNDFRGLQTLTHKPTLTLTTA